MANKAAAGYSFNTMQDIKSHSSVLYNERMAILFYLLDMKNLAMYQSQSVASIFEVFAVQKQIYKNVRMLLRFNPTVRVTMRLDTKDEGIYTPDIIKHTIEEMIEYCQSNGWTEKRIRILIFELENFETIMKDLLQYFSYFIRPDFKQKPDVDMASERYKEMVDKRTVEELREIMGKNALINLDELSGETIKLFNKDQDIEYDPDIDGDMEQYLESEYDDIELEDEEQK